jgi:hypothetical protein
MTHSEGSLPNSMGHVLTPLQALLSRKIGPGEMDEAPIPR